MKNINKCIFCKFPLPEDKQERHKHTEIHAQEARDKIMEIGLKTGCGHIASAMSVASVLAQTYQQNRKAIVILSKGHGVLAQYVILNMIGKMSFAKLATYYQNGGLSGHSTLDPKNGIYASTGSLGHGLAIGIGYAIADPSKNVVVIMSDGECEEGSTLEALALIRRLKILNLLPVVDVNGWQGFKDTPTEYLPVIPYMGGSLIKPYYSVKGEGMGKFENTLASHYQKVTPELYQEYLNLRSKENERDN